MRVFVMVAAGLFSASALAADIGYCEGRAGEVRNYLSQAETAKDPKMAELHLGMAEVYMTTMTKLCDQRTDIAVKHAKLRLIYPPK